MNISDIVDMYKYNGGPLEEYIWESTMDCDSWCYDERPMILDSCQSDILEYLKNEKYTEKEIDSNIDEINENIIHAYANAYRDSYQNDLSDQLFNALETRCNDIGLKWFYTGGCKYSAESITFYATKKELLAWSKETLIFCYNGKESVYDSIANGLVSYFWEHCRDEIGDYIYEETSKKVTSDSRQDSYAEVSAILQMFQEYNEIEYCIKQDRKNKQSKIKGMIRNHVPLQYRESVLSA